MIEGHYETDALMHQDLREYDPFQWEFGVWDHRHRSLREWDAFLGLRARPVLQDAVQILNTK